MGGVEEVLGLDALGQAELLRLGEVTATELASAAIGRIEAENPRLNAVVIPLYERALARAHRPHPGPFAGVPLLMKDAGQELKGTPHWVATPVLRRLGHRSPTTTPLAARLEELGFVVLGKTNLPELSAGGTTEPPRRSSMSRCSRGGGVCPAPAAVPRSC